MQRKIGQNLAKTEIKFEKISKSFSNFDFKQMEYNFHISEAAKTGDLIGKIELKEPINSSYYHLIGDGNEKYFKIKFLKNFSFKINETGEILVFCDWAEKPNCLNWQEKNFFDLMVIATNSGKISLISIYTKSFRRRCNISDFDFYYG